jgi:hypothetical protein
MPKARLAQFSASSHEHERLIRTLTDLIVDCGHVYRDSDDETRRAYNQAWFERILLDLEGPHCIVTAPRRTEAVQEVKPPQSCLSRQDPGPGLARDATLSNTASIRMHRV